MSYASAARKPISSDSVIVCMRWIAPTRYCGVRGHRLQIAFELGYSDPAHFARTIVNWTGETLSAWRRRLSSA